MAPQGHQRAVQGRKQPAEAQGGQKSPHSLGMKTTFGPIEVLPGVIQQRSHEPGHPEEAENPRTGRASTKPELSCLSVRTRHCILAGAQETRAFQTNLHVSYPGNWLTMNLIQGGLRPQILATGVSSSGRRLGVFALKNPSRPRN